MSELRTVERAKEIIEELRHVLLPSEAPQRLPRKFSDAIRVIVDDLRRVALLPSLVKINMSTWCNVNDATRPCEVCLAGLQMLLGRIDALMDAWGFSPDDSDVRDSRRADALDRLRKGKIDNALCYWEAAYADEADNTDDENEVDVVVLVNSHMRDAQLDSQHRFHRLANSQLLQNGIHGNSIGERVWLMQIAHFFESIGY